MVDITTFSYINGYLNLKVVMPEQLVQDNCYIEGIYLCTPETYNTRADWYAVYQYDDTYPDSKKTEYPNTDEPIPISSNTFTDNEDMYILIVECAGTPGDDVPCRYQKPRKEAAILYAKDMYNYAINTIKNIEGSCSNLGAFNDFMFRYKAVELAVKSCDIAGAVEYYKRFFGVSTANTGHEINPYSYNAQMNGGCGCGHY